MLFMESNKLYIAGVEFYKFMLYSMVSTKEKLLVILRLCIAILERIYSIRLSYIGINNTDSLLNCHRML